MLAFLVSLLLVSAYQPYVRPLRRAHAQHQYTYPFFGGFEWGDMEDYLPFLRPSGGNRGSQGSQSNAGGAFSPFTPYMHNPMGLNMQKCMDNDMCSGWVAHHMYNRGAAGGGYGPNTGSQTGQQTEGTTTEGGDTGGAEGDAGGEQTGGEQTGGEQVDTGSQTQTQTNNGNNGGHVSFSPSMFGFPAGFNPMAYGLDWDAQPIDCMDDSKCARGMMMYGGGRAIQSAVSGNGMYNFSLDPRLISYASEMFGFPSLQRTRRLSRARYGYPYRYGY